MAAQAGRPADPRRHARVDRGQRARGSRGPDWIVRMQVAIVTGSGGLVGSQTVEHFVHAGYRVIGLENDMRAAFFGAEASTRPVTERLGQRLPEFTSLEVDIRDPGAV